MLEAVFTRLCFDRALQYSIVSTSLALHLIKWRVKPKFCVMFHPEVIK